MTSTQNRPVALVAALVATIGLAITVALRLQSVAAEFPSGDGGLFWVTAADLRDHGFVPPDFATYNTRDIPWVYPPIGIYLAALLGNDLSLFQFLPAAFAIATVPALWLLARELIGERGALVATVAYGLSAPAYIGLIAGGGVTRGPGLLLGVLAMWAVVRGNVAGAGVLGGLTLLAHPIAAAYTVLSAGALWASRGADRRMLLAIPLALAVAAAWYAPAIARHGLDPFLAGAGSRDVDIVDNAVLWIARTVNPPNLAFTIGAGGIVFAVTRRRWDLLAWLAVSALGAAVVDRWLVMPLAVLSGLAVDWALERPRSLAGVALVAGAGVAAATGVLLAEGPVSLTADEREVMEWARTETQQDATFAVIGYPVDLGFVEWFPALSGRENLTTWQGSEWVPGGFTREAATSAAACRDPACLPDADYYVLAPGCCAAIADELFPVRPGVYASVTSVQLHAARDGGSS